MKACLLFIHIHLPDFDQVLDFDRLSFIFRENLMFIILFIDLFA